MKRKPKKKKTEIVDVISHLKLTYFCEIRLYINLFTRIHANKKKFADYFICVNLDVHKF